MAINTNDFQGFYATSSAKFNEETMENEIVTTSYYDEYNEVEVIEEKVTYLKPEDSAKNIEGVHKITYDGLDSDTIYTAVLDEFSVTSVNFKDVYKIVTDKQCAVIVNTEEEFKSELHSFYENSDKYKQYCENAKTVFDENRGAINYVIERI